MPSPSETELQELLEEARRLSCAPIGSVEDLEGDGQLSVPERYDHGELVVHVHLRLAADRTDTQACELCALYQKVAVRPQERAESDDLGASDRDEHRAKLDGLWAYEHAMQGSVPVYTRQLVNNGKKVLRRGPARSSRSAVGLQLLDECRSGLRDAFEGGSLGGFPEGPSVGLEPDWEGVVLSRLLVVCLDERPDQMFQAGSHLVDRLSDQDREAWLNLGRLGDVCRVFRPPGLAWPQSLSERLMPLGTLRSMADKREPTQKTQPKKGKPVEIPVPKRSSFDRLLKKAAGVSSRDKK